MMFFNQRLYRQISHTTLEDPQHPLTSTFSESTSQQTDFSAFWGILYRQSCLPRFARCVVDP